MKSVKDSMLLYAVTDRTWTGKQSLYEQITDCLKGGVTCLQLREKDLDDESFLKEAQEIKKLCHEHDVPFIVNDNVDIAIKVQADGVHIGQHDMSADKVRALIGEDMLLGVSVQTVEQALAAETAGADYLGVGAVFSTGTKTDADDVDIDTLKSICDAVEIPVVAIGGICLDNAHKLCGSGIDGIAVVSAIFAQDNIQKATSQLLAKAKECVSL